jgi:hypothetical protein
LPHCDEYGEGEGEGWLGRINKCFVDSLEFFDFHNNSKVYVYIIPGILMVIVKFSVLKNAKYLQLD